MNKKIVFSLVLLGILLSACSYDYSEPKPPRYKIIVDGVSYSCFDYHRGSTWTQLVGCTGYSDDVWFGGTFKMEVHRIEKEK